MKIHRNTLQEPLKIMDEKLIQKHSLYITKLHAAEISSAKLKGIASLWKDDTAYITFYFKQQPTDKELEDVSDVCTAVVAHMPKGMIQEKIVILDASQPILSEFLAYKTI